MSDIPIILQNKWRAANDHASTILGVFSEEGREYEITCPPRLREEIIRMQNFMVDRYREIEEKLAALQKAKLEWYEATRKYDINAPGKKKIVAENHIGNADEPFTFTVARGSYNDSDDPYITTKGLDDE